MSSNNFISNSYFYKVIKRMDRTKKIFEKTLLIASNSPVNTLYHCAGEEVPGGVAPLGHGKREGPTGDKFPRSGDAGNGGRVRSGAKRNGAPPGTSFSAL